MRNSWRPDVPYNDLPAPPPVDVLETRSVLKAAIAANAALAQLGQAAMSMPNPAVLINTIPLLEAQASSEIETIVTTTDELFRHMDDDEGTTDSAARETLRCRTALRTGFEAVRDRGLTVATAEQVCSTIQGRDMSVRALPGMRIANPLPERASTARLRGETSFARSWPSGSGSSTPTMAWTRWCGLLPPTTSSKPYSSSTGSSWTS